MPESENLHKAHVAGSTPACDVTIFVCVSCRRLTDAGDAFEQPGSALVTALQSRLDDRAASNIIVTPVDCLAVCKRPCTVAIKADEKWTYLIGDLDPAEHADEIVSAVRSYQMSDNGIVPWKERPMSFRKGVVARIPPIGFVQPPLPETA